MNPYLDIIYQIGQGRIVILIPPSPNANLENLWALVTKTIGHPLQLRIVTAQYKEPGKKPHGKNPPL